MRLSWADQEEDLEMLARLDPVLAERKRAEWEAAAQAEREERAAARSGKTPLERTPMSEREQAAVKALNGCRFGYGGGRAGSFVNSMNTILRWEVPGITKRQRKYLWMLVYRYRRQIGNEGLVAEAKKLAGIKGKR